MAVQQSRELIHALTIPTQAGILLVPSALIAEVVNVSEMAPLPLSPPWVLGAVGWRSLAVTVVSFEALLGGRVSEPAPHSKAVVFYPVAGRPQTEFFAVLSSAEPRPQTVDGSDVSLAPTELPKTPFVAGGLKHNGSELWIPNLDALKKAFYPF